MGLAWGAPLLPAVLADFVPGTAAHPRLYRLFDHHGWYLLTAMVALCCLGIAFVAFLTHRPSRVRLAWVFVPVALILVVAMPFTAPYDSSDALFLVYALTWQALPIAVVALGVAVTVATLWRRFWWAAATWLALWLGGVVFVAIATWETTDSGSPADGLIVLPVVAALLAVAVLAATLASVLSSVPDWMTYAGRIEQGVRADSQKLTPGA